MKGFTAIFKRLFIDCLTVDNSNTSFLHSLLFSLFGSIFQETHPYQIFKIVSITNKA